MKAITYIAIILSVALFSCEKDMGYDAGHYANELSFNDSSDLHPEGPAIQALIDEFVSSGALGVSVMINNESGTWLGCGGYADLTSGVPVTPGSQFMIASISKVFTATCVFSYIEEGLLAFDDPISEYLDRSITDRIGNGDIAQIKHLLGHVSGIPDYYTTKMIMNQYNKKDNEWLQEDLLEYVYDKKPKFAPDEKYDYSNTNYLLLGMILEEVSGLSLEEIYRQKIFTPLDLKNAWYGVGDFKTPEAAVKGYFDLYGIGEYVESDNLYLDEVGVGGDGGIGINAQDLGKFFMELLAGNIVSEASVNQMTAFFDRPALWNEDEMYRNGFGIEYFENDGEDAWGHTGGIDGFISALQYFPESDVTVVILMNFVFMSEPIYYAFEDFTEGLREELALQ